MSVSSLFQENDFTVKCKDLQVAGELKDQFNSGGGNFDIFTSTGTGTAWRVNINGMHLSSGGALLGPNEFMGQGYMTLNSNFASFVTSQPIIIRCFACRTVLQPLGPSSYTFELYKNGLPTGVTAVIAGDDTTASSAVVNIPLAQYEVYSVFVTLNGSPVPSAGSVTIDYIYQL